MVYIVCDTGVFIGLDMPELRNAIYVNSVNSYSALPNKKSHRNVLWPQTITNSSGNPEMALSCTDLIVVALFMALASCKNSP